MKPVTRVVAAAKAKEAFLEMEKLFPNADEKLWYCPSSVAVLWVPDRRAPSQGLAYVASGIRNQYDDVDSRRPKQGPNLTLEAPIKKNIENAVDNATNDCKLAPKPLDAPDRAKSSKIKDFGAKRPLLGHRTCFACAEMHVLNFTILQMGITDEKFKFPDGTSIFVFGYNGGRAETAAYTKPSDMPPCYWPKDIPCSRKGEKDDTDSGSVQEYYPNGTTAGCKTFLQLLNVQF